MKAFSLRYTLQFLTQHHPLIFYCFLLRRCIRSWQKHNANSTSFEQFRVSGISVFSIPAYIIPSFPDVINNFPFLIGRARSLIKMHSSVVYFTLLCVCVCVGYLPKSHNYSYALPDELCILVLVGPRRKLVLTRSGCKCRKTRIKRQVGQTGLMHSSGDHHFYWKTRCFLQTFAMGMESLHLFGVLHKERLQCKFSARGHTRPSHPLTCNQAKSTFLFFLMQNKNILRQCICLVLYSLEL